MHNGLYNNHILYYNMGMLFITVNNIECKQAAAVITCDKIWHYSRKINRDLYNTILSYIVILWSTDNGVTGAIGIYGQFLGSWNFLFIINAVFIEQV